MLEYKAVVIAAKPLDGGMVRQDMTIGLVNDCEPLLTQLAEQALAAGSHLSVDMQELLLAGAVTKKLPEMGAFIAVWPQPANHYRNDSQRKKHCDRLVRKLTGVCHSYAGRLVNALDIWAHDYLFLSDGQLLSRLLPTELRSNIFAEIVYGNHYLAPEDVILRDPQFWGVTTAVLQQRYGRGSFYMHPAGLNHEGRSDMLEYLTCGLPVNFELEPHNAYDVNAVHIWGSEGCDLGYVPRQIAALMAFRLRHGTSYDGYVAGIYGTDDDSPYGRVVIKVDVRA